jgi:acyl-[acyl carrier protein]--UDP-N-acetylglucosamine O-acyltransferase
MQGTSAVGKDVLPFAIAIGRNSIGAINVIGLRRAGFGPALRAEAKSAYELCYGQGLNLKTGTGRSGEADLGAGNDDIPEFHCFLRPGLFTGRRLRPAPQSLA